jgi:biopolymer transport protein ExbB
MSKRKIFFAMACVLFLLCGALALSSVAGDGTPTMEEGLTFRELLRSGGSVMVVIEGVSIVVVALGIIAFIVIRRRRVIPDEIVEEIAKHIKKGELKKAFAICAENESPFSRIFGAGLKRALELLPPRKTSSRGNLYLIQKVFVMDNIKHSMEAVGMREMERMRSLVAWFSNLGVISPMLGLLGTVLGMIQAFGAIAFKVEAGKPVLLSSAISKAMVTTAGGLVVGITSMLLYYFFSSKISIIVANTEDIAEALIDEVEKGV